jgi:hypothetical protein
LNTVLYLLSGPVKEFRVVRDNRIKQKVDDDVTPADGQSSDLCNGKVATDNVDKRYLPFLIYRFHLFLGKKKLGFLIYLHVLISVILDWVSFLAYPIYLGLKALLLLCWVMPRMCWNVPAVNIYI